MWSVNRFLTTTLRRLPNTRGLKMTVTDDGSTVIAYHPEPLVAYEDSLPLPARSTEPPETSPLRRGLIEARADASNYQPIKGEDKVAKRRLAQLTLTTVHRWYPRARDKRAKNTAPDRPYL